MSNISGIIIALRTGCLNKRANITAFWNGFKRRQTVFLTAAIERRTGSLPGQSSTSCFRRSEEDGDEDEDFEDDEKEYGD